MRFKEFLMQEKAKDGFRDMAYDEIKAADAYAKKHGIALGSGRVNDKTGDIHVAGPNKLKQFKYGVIKKKVKEDELDEAGKVHTIRKPEIQPRGEPEVQARAFDVRHFDRSVLKKVEKDVRHFYHIQGEIDWFDRSDPKNDEMHNAHPNSAMVQVMGGGVSDADISKGKYHGINVVFTMQPTKPELKLDSKPDLVCGDPIAQNQADKYEKEIVVAALDGLAAGDIEGTYSGLGGKTYTIGKIKNVAEYKRKHGY